MAKLDVMEKIEKSKKRDKGRYNMSLRDLIKVRECSPDDYAKLSNAFDYGFYQGYKAAMAEMNKKSKEARAV